MLTVTSFGTNSVASQTTCIDDGDAEADAATETLSR